MHVMLLTVTFTALAVFILHGMSPWVSSWPNGELRRNNHEQQVNVLTVSGSTEYPKDQLRARGKVLG